MELSVNMVKITPKVQPYPWGDDSFIPSLLGKESDGKPQAELWFGTHPGGESALPDSEPLGDFLRDHDKTFLGEEQVKRHGKELPFLLKVLAIAQPLSLQVHPSAEQALHGYTEELPRHVDIPQDQWNYKDGRQKAEVLYALTPVTAMCGFLPIPKLSANLMRLLPYQFPLVFPFLQEPGEEDETQLLQRFFTTLYTLEQEQRELLLAEFKENLEVLQEDSYTVDGKWLTPAGIARLCLESYPDDLGVFAPFFLQVLHLEEGEAVYLEPRTLHAYVRGHGVELMSNSDNVLRGGLTNKKVDVPELLKTLAFKAHNAGLCPQIRDTNNRLNILAPTDDFLLGVYERGTYHVDNRFSIEFLLCSEGTAEIVKDNQTHKLAQGECLVVASSVESYRITVKGKVFSASVPG